MDTLKVAFKKHLESLVQQVLTRWRMSFVFPFNGKIRLALFLSNFPLLALYVLAAAVLIPSADAPSTRSGLTITAQMLGVLIGASLVIASVLQSGRQNANALVRHHFSKYRMLLDENKELIKDTLSDFLQKSQDGIWTFGPGLSMDCRRVISNLATLAFELRVIGRNEWTDITHKFPSEYWQKQLTIETHFDSVEFMQLVHDTMIQLEYDTSSLSPISRFAHETNERMYDDGLRYALVYSEDVTDLLKSRLLATHLAILLLTEIATIITIFGLPDSPKASTIPLGSILNSV